MNPSAAAHVVRSIVTAAHTRSLELLLTSPLGFGLTTATPLQRALCRVLDGTPLEELAAHEHVTTAMGDMRGWQGRPFEAVVLSGTRVGKSLTAAALAVLWSQTCSVEGLGAGDTPRVSIVSLTRDLGAALFAHLRNNVERSPVLKPLLVSEPTADTVVLRHPSGMPVEIQVVAGKGTGSSLVARWSAGVIFDEAPRMLGQSEGVVNLDDMRHAVLSRIRPGAQIVYIGSPWAPFGPVHKWFTERWRKPTNDMLVVRADARLMNPVWWTDERCADLERRNPDAYETDVKANFLSPEENLFGDATVRSATRGGPEQLPYQAGHDYAAGIDAATRGNAWTLVIATREGKKRRVVLAKQWQGSKQAPLSSRATLREIAALCKPYKVTSLRADGWAIDPLMEHAYDAGVTLEAVNWNTEDAAAAYWKVSQLMVHGECELAPNEQLAEDLKRVKRKPRANGFAIVLPETADGRHCDYAPAMVRSLAGWLDDVEGPLPDLGTAERADHDERRREQREEQEHTRRSRSPWWAGGPSHGFKRPR
jgi:hypothetical protein